MILLFGWHEPRSDFERERLASHELQRIKSADDVEPAWHAARDYVFERYYGPDDAGPHSNGRYELRPWAWWRFDSPEPRIENETEDEQLARLGLLTDLDRKRRAAIDARRAGQRERAERHRQACAEVERKRQTRRKHEGEQA